jgi:hypothetical protein
VDRSAVARVAQLVARRVEYDLHFSFVDQQASVDRRKAIE